MSKTRILKSNPYKNTTLSSKVIHALALGKGITWLDEVRLPTTDKLQSLINETNEKDLMGNMKGKNAKGRKIIFRDSEKGRFPANLLVSDDILNDGIERKTAERSTSQQYETEGLIYGRRLGITAYHSYKDSGSYSRYFDLDKWWEKVISDE